MCGAVHGRRRGVSAGQLAMGGILTVYGAVHRAMCGGLMSSVLRFLAVYGGGTAVYRDWSRWFLAVQGVL